MADKEKYMGQKDNVIVVRIKRRREDEPTESICLVEGEKRTGKKRVKAKHGLLTGLAKLSTSEEDAPAQMMMHRIGTIESTDGDVDQATLSKIKLPQPAEESVAGSSSFSLPSSRPSRPPQKPPTIFVARGKKRLKDTDGTSPSSLLVVDLSSSTNKRQRVAAVKRAEPCAEAAPADLNMSCTSKQTGTQPSKSSGAIRVLNPVTQQLDNMLNSIKIDTSFTPTTDVTQRMSSGVGMAVGVMRHMGWADVNHQRTSDGLSTLMMAVMAGNISHVTVLLGQGAIATDENAAGISALSIARTIRQQNVSNMLARQVLLLLQKKAVVETRERDGPDEGMCDGEDDYVFDVFLVKKSTSVTQQAVSDIGQAICGNSAADDAKASDNGGDCAAGISIAADMETVQVPGVSFDGGADGEEEYTFVYDSDWSELAGDEDPESNDERHYANDYPDEESDDGDLFDDEDYNRDRHLAMSYQNDDELHKADGDSSDNDDDIDDDDYDVMGRRHIRRLDPNMSIRQQYPADYRSSHTIHPQTQGSAEDEGHGNDSDHHYDDVMQEEVTIPRYGRALSSDDEMDQHEKVWGDTDAQRPPLSTVAYESEEDDDYCQ